MDMGLEEFLTVLAVNLAKRTQALAFLDFNG